MLKRIHPGFTEEVKRYEALLFFLFLLLFCLVIYGDFLSAEPMYFHAWAQTDRFCVALRYVENGLNFFKPQVCNLGNNDGTTGMEFPILYYVSAIFMKLFSSESPVFVRAISMLVSLVGLTFLYRTFRQFNIGVSLSILAVCLVFSNPIFLYYQANFNPNHVALGLCFMAVWHFFQFEKNQSIQHFAWFNFLVTIGALCKTSFTLYFLAFHIYTFLTLRTSPRKTVFRLFSFLVSIGLMVSQYRYNQYLNTRYNAHFFTNNPEMFDSLAEGVPRLFHDFLHWSQQLLLPTSIGVVSLASVIFIFTGWRRVTVHSVLLLGLIAGGCLSVLWLMGQQFRVHDYYFIDVFYLPLALFLIPLFHHLQEKWGDALYVKSAVLILIFLTLNQGYIWFTKKLFLYLPDRCDLITNDFLGSYQVLDSLGISRAEKIGVLDPYATNEILYYLKRKGYTSSAIELDVIENWKEKKVNYLVAESISIQRFPNQFTSIEGLVRRIYQNEKFSVFQIR